MLRAMPALVVLERLPFAILAVAEDGTILFANEACADMLGYLNDDLVQLKYRDIFHVTPDDDSPVKAVQANAGLVVQLAHKDGSIVRAKMSRSALMRGGDPVALAAFHDLTAQLWTEEV